MQELVVEPAGAGVRGLAVGRGAGAAVAGPLLAAPPPRARAAGPAPSALPVRTPLLASSPPPHLLAHHTLLALLRFSK